MKPVDYALLDELLEDDSLSLRQRAERAGCSDWTARQRYRKLSGDDRPMKAPRVQAFDDETENSDPQRWLSTTETVITWSVFGLFVVCVAALGWYARRAGFPPFPPEAPMQ